MLLRTLSVALLACLSFAAAAAEPAATGTPTPNAPATGPDKSPPALKAAADSNSSYIACYFAKGSEVKWQWGLNTDSSYYQVSGTWFTTPYTKLQKFNAGSVTQSSLQTACTNAQTYYGLLGYNLFAFFAATSNTGSNYPIISNGVELFPMY